MAKKYRSLAEEIVKLIGGKDNISDAYHCQTRLRFKLRDESRADDETLKNLDGVASVIRNAGVYQVVIGTHVADVFEEVAEVADLKSKGTAAEEAGEKKGILSTVIDFVAGVFQPIIPALSGVGVVKAVLALLVVFHVINSDSQTYVLLNMFADAVFYFLPVLLAFTEAQKLKCNLILAAGTACIMLHPTWAGLVAAAEPLNFFEFIPFQLVTYANSVIPVILVVFVQARIEKWLNRVVPKSVNLVFVPMLVFLIMGTLALSVLGPLGNIVGQGLAVVFNYLAENAAWAPALLVGGLLPVMVMFGIHNGVAPLGVMQMANLGYDSIFGPGCVCSNMAQAAAGTVVAIRAKNAKERQIASSGAITAYMGITEPLLYGVNLPKKYPLIASMIGGACGGLYAGLTHTHRFATGSSGLPAVLLYIGDDTMTFFYNIIIAILISAAVSAVLTWILASRFEKKEAAEAAAAADKAAAEAVTETVVVEKPASAVILSPVAGDILPLEQAKDEAFASGALGQGAVIDPKTGLVIAPFDGTVTALFPTKHAIGLTSREGIELLIHVGINTVELNGEHFETFVTQGDTVRRGQKLIGFDLEKIAQAGYPTQTMVIVTNTPAFESVSVQENPELH
ncbi:beta-glucoside-specific PTS transporter subunit IIABC [uncultured Faecalibaculum sp.]|uniref:beta-glucoside-specific PTS transporter subunit IIABC n=1 Tax=uncultured Faecalibaculum sp. TaxID=1729681 RepID=UPI0025D7601E|nr:beta-glucoside-specific PTS transporter subunit IIABC [uncultured Faecalibaculum sp.]